MAKEFEFFIKNAVEWAKKYINESEYAFRCLAFAEDAYERSNNLEIFGGSSAMESAVEYGCSKNIGEPPLGSFVFYDCSGSINGTHDNYGHVGLCIGEGKVIHAWDKVRIDHYLDVQTLRTAADWTKPKFIGWSPVERIFQGYKKH